MLAQNTDVKGFWYFKASNYKLLHFLDILIEKKVCQNVFRQQYYKKRDLGAADFQGSLRDLRSQVTCRLTAI